MYLYLQCKIMSVGENKIKVLSLGDFAIESSELLENRIDLLVKRV